ncbi:ATP-binding protein [Maricaulis sp. MIT060901]|uniref:GAF domain-containing sensor histidine kinase n=1 Tax=Maricaulis sp. MIT060901 TaxID=3096993 RepID=UPI00399A83C1
MSPVPASMTASEANDRPPSGAMDPVRVFREFAVDVAGIREEVQLYRYVARNVVARLGYIDCVVYRLDRDRGELVQMAAIGEKTLDDEDGAIINRLTIPVGDGITGTVATTGQSIRIDELADDPRYIQDLMQARSELCVPILVGERIVGVIDSEHHEPGFFSPKCQELFESIAALTAAQLRHIWALDELTHARSELEDALEISRNAEQMQASFLANASHELRTPLNAIIGFSGLLTREGYIAEDTGRALEQAETIKTAGDRLARIINDILDLSKIAGGKLPSALESFDAIWEAENAMAPFQHMASESGVTLALDDDGADELLAVGDIRHVHRILGMLLENAIRYSPEGGTVHVRISADDDDVAIGIEDSGIGLDDEALDRIFEPFHREEDATEISTEGTGLGLTLARELADLNFARISVQSAPGVGSRFALHLQKADEG